jgi:MATE family multidrug resistance protein
MMASGSAGSESKVGSGSGSASAPTLRLLLALAGPMILARATQAVIGAADTYQVSHLGPQAVAATATGGLNTYGLIMLPMGTVFIVQSFVSQLVGKGTPAETPRFAWYGLMLAALAGLFAVATIPFAPDALGLFGFEPAVHDQMTDYVQIRLYAVAAIVGMEALGNWYGGLGNTWMAMIAGIIAMVVDVFLNWVLIDGNLGAPAMGVSGAALSSSISSVVGFLFLLIAFLLRRGAAPRGSGGKLSGRELWRVVRFGAPNGFKWFLEFAAFQLFVNAVLGDLGTSTLAAFNVVLSINMVSFMPAFGLASAGAILAGMSIGRGHHHLVWPTVKLTLYVAAVWMGLIGSVYALAPHLLLSVFAQGGSRAIVELGAVMLMLSAAWQLFDAIGLTLSETLRAAGDTAWTMMVRLLLAWFVFMPAAYYVVRYADGGAVGAMLCLAGYIAILAGLLAYRFRGGAWKQIRLIEPSLV